MNRLVNIVCIGMLVAAELAVLAPALAQPTDKMARPGPGRPDGGRPGGGNNGRPPGGGSNIGRPPGGGNVGRPPGGGNVGRPPGGGNVGRPPGGNYRPPGNGFRPPNNNRPPHGGNYRPPRPPPGGWQGGYRPPQNYYYDRGPSTGSVIAGVAVAGGLIALLSAANRSNNATQAQNQQPAYAPPPGSSGNPANVNVDLNGIAAAARPSASTCLTEAAREIGATGGSEIRLDGVDNVEKGNGGYRFRMTLLGVYPDETRRIPMFCRATPDKIVELTFG